LDPKHEVADHYLGTPRPRNYCNTCSQADSLKDQLHLVRVPGLLPQQFCGAAPGSILLVRERQKNPTVHSMTTIAGSVIRSIAVFNIPTGASDWKAKLGR
jgi:hypothetical protein